jgi:homocysteine S-methyltransferase
LKVQEDSSRDQNIKDPGVQFTATQFYDNGKTLILDGALGTELMHRGIDLPLPLWSAEANATHPEVVLAVHKEYAAAGANIITTNTFRTTPRSYRNAGYSGNHARRLARDRMQRAVELAQQASQGRLMVAGSIAPLEDCYLPGLAPEKNIAEEEFAELCLWLDEFGADIILFETMGNAHEIEGALAAAQEINRPIALSLLLKDEITLFDGTKAVKIFRLAREKGITVMLANCAPVDIIEFGIETISKHWSGPWGVYPNLGISMPERSGHIEAYITNSRFIQQVKHYKNKGAAIIGSCCGSTPAHTELIARTLRNLNASS